MTSNKTIYEFIYEPLASTPEDFRKLALQCADIIPEKIDELIETIHKNRWMWDVYQTRHPQNIDYLNRQTAFIWIQNYSILCELYYKKGYSAESILAELGMTCTPESLRKILKSYFRQKIQEEVIITNKHRGKNKGKNKVRYDLIPAEDEMIRLYLDGMALERIGLEFNCSYSTVRDVIVEHGYYTPLNQKKVKDVAYSTLREAGATRKSARDTKRAEERRLKEIEKAKKRGNKKPSKRTIKNYTPMDFESVNFIRNRYYRKYVEITENAKIRELPEDCYTETHHIIPFCMGGPDLPENLVKLTAKEHYVCHRLLTRITVGNNRRQMHYAMMQMTLASRTHARNDIRITSAAYAKIRENLSETASIDATGRYYWTNGMEQIVARECPGEGFTRGRLLPVRTWWNDGASSVLAAECPGEGWVIGSIRKVKKHVWNNGIRRAVSVECPGEGWVRGGLPPSEETREKIRAARALQNMDHMHKPKSAEHRANLSKSKKEKARLNRVVCEHCGKETDQINHKKWHGDNCKLNPNKPK